MNNYTKTFGKFPKTFITDFLRKLNNLLRAIIILLFAIGFILNPVFAQIDSLNISEVTFFDRFGNIHNPNDLNVPSEEDIIRHSHQCTAGFFQLTFIDIVVGDTNQGFNDPDSILAQGRRDLVCQVFTDLAQLIMSSNDPCTGTLPTVEIAVFSNFKSPIFIPPGALAAASSIYKSTGGTTGYIDGEVWKTINTGTNSLANFGSLFHVL